MNNNETILERQTVDNRQWEELLKPALAHLGCEYWGSEKRQEGHRSILCIYIDKPGGVTVGDCAQVSRELSALLEVEGGMDLSYSLEVSSPGILRPLFTLSQYQQFIGQTVQVKFHDKWEERRQILGLLTAVGDNTLTIEADGNVYTLPFLNVAKGNLVIAEYSEAKHE